MCLKNRLVFSGMREETNLWCSRILWDFNSLTSSTRQIKSPRCYGTKHKIYCVEMAGIKDSPRIYL